MKKCIGGHAEDVRCVHCTVDPVRTGNGVPRNALGWPLLTPEEMTDDQLRREAGRWRKTAMHAGPGTVGDTPKGLMPDEGVMYLGRHHKPRNPASIGTDASCPMTDTEFDSDPSVVME